jgi:hypothetical protein
MSSLYLRELEVIVRRWEVDIGFMAGRLMTAWRHDCCRRWAGMVSGIVLLADSRVMIKSGCQTSLLKLTVIAYMVAQRHGEHSAEKQDLGSTPLMVDVEGFRLAAGTNQ